MSSHQLNPKTNDLVLLLKIFLNLMKLSPVATGGTNGNGLKLKKLPNFFEFLRLRAPKFLKKFIMVRLALSDKILIPSS